MEHLLAGTGTRRPWAEAALGRGWERSAGLAYRRRENRCRAPVRRRAVARESGAGHGAGSGSAAPEQRELVARALHRGIQAQQGLQVPEVHLLTGCPVADVVRLDEVPAPGIEAITQ